MSYAVADIDGCAGDPCSGDGSSCFDRPAPGVGFKCACDTGYGMKPGSSDTCEACTDGTLSQSKDGSECEVHETCDKGFGLTNAGTSTTQPTCTPCASPYYSASNDYDVCHNANDSREVEWLSSSSVECAAGYHGVPTYDQGGSYSTGCTGVLAWAKNIH